MRLIRRFLGLFFLSSAIAGAQTTQSLTPQSYSASIQTILHVEAGDADILTPLRAVISSHGRDQGLADKALDELVLALNRGARPDALLHVVLSTVHVDMSSATPAPNDDKLLLANSATRSDIAELIWTRAELMATAKDANSPNYARAAILLAAQEDFVFGPPLVYGLVTSAEDAGKLRSILQLDEAQHKALLEFVKLRDRTEGDFEKSYIDAIKLSERVRKEPTGAQFSQNVQLTLKHLAELKPVSLADTYKQINATWECKNLFSSRHDEKAIADTLILLKSWQRDASDLTVKRWLEEAADRTEKPRRLYVHYNVLPTGEEVELDE